MRSVAVILLLVGLRFCAAGQATALDSAFAPHISGARMDSLFRYPALPNAKPGVSLPLGSVLKKRSLAITYEAGYNSGDWSYGATSGWYQRIGIDKSLTVGRLPFRVSFAVPIDKWHNPLRDQFSSFGFDYNRYLDELKRKAVADLQKQKDALIQQHFAVPNVKDSLAYLARYESSYKTFSASYLKLRAHAVADSSAPDSTRRAYRHYRNSLEALYTQASKRYNRLLAYREQYHDAVAYYRQPLRKIDSTVALVQTGNLTTRARAKANELLNEKLPVSDKVRAFNLGAYSLSVSPLTVYSQFLNGVQYAGTVKGMYVHGAAGLFNYPHNLSGFQRYRAIGFNKYMAYAEAGPGSPDDDYSHLSLVYARTNPVFTDGKSLVAAYTRQEHLGDRCEVKACVAKSLLGSAAGFEGTNTQNFLSACAADIDAHARIGCLSAESEVTATGSGFVNYAVQVPQTNQLVYQLKAAVDARRFAVSVSGLRASPLQSYANAYLIHRSQANAQLQIKLNRQLRLLGIETAGVWRGQSRDGASAYRSMFQSTGTGFAAHAKFLGVAHDCMLMYTRNASAYGGVVSRYDQVQADETVSFSPRQQLDVHAMWYSLPNAPSSILDQYNLLASYVFTVSKLRASAGLQYLRNDAQHANLVGTQLSVAWPIGKSLDASMQADYKCDRLVHPATRSLFGQLQLQLQL